MGSTAWEAARTFLSENISGWDEPDSTDILTLPMADEDWLLEITSDGRLVCMAGYDMDDMKSLLSDGTAEDLGSDELAKQAKFYLQQTVSKYRKKLLGEGFTESIEMNESYVAATFHRSVDLTDLPQLQSMVRTYRDWFRPSS